MIRLREIVLSVIVLLICTGCPDNPGVSLPTVETSQGGSTVLISSITVGPAGPVILSVSESQQMTAQAFDTNNAQLSNVTFSWQTSDPDVATVTGSGLVNATGPGTAQITAKSKGITSNAVSINVDCNGIPSVISSISASPASITNLGTSAIFVTVEDCDPTTPPDVPDGTPVSFTVAPSTIGQVTPLADISQGKASATFSAGASPGIANITATVESVSSSTPVTITAAGIGSIEFGSAAPQVIGLKNSGQTENSLITFVVKDVNGFPSVDGTRVLFTLIGPQGTSTSAPTDLQREALTTYLTSTTSGNAVTTLLSGSVAGPVRIIACVDGNGNLLCDAGEITSSSTPLSIGGGVPSATHFSVPRTIINLAGLDYVNEQTQLSAFLADRFGNFNVLEGTSVSFYTEAGAIDRSALTDADGTATVTLRTQNPMPIDTDPRDPLNPIGGETYVNGNENGYDGGTVDDPDGDGCFNPATPSFILNGPFVDSNGNGIRDFGEAPGEPFVDENLDGCYDVGEEFQDQDGSGYDLAEPNPRDGWVTVLAVAKGEEAFSDLNGNGLYDAGEPFTDNGGEPFIDANDNGIYDKKESFVDANFNGTYDLGEAFTDIDAGEPYLDVNGNGSHDSGEPFTDLNGNLSYDSSGFADGVYDPGELFVDVNGDGKWTHGNGVWDSDTTIWVSQKLVFTSGAYIGPYQSRIVINADSRDPLAPSKFFSTNGNCSNFDVYVSDVNANTLTAGSSVTITASGGSATGTGTFNIADTQSIGPWHKFVTICDANSADFKAQDGITLDVKGKSSSQFAGSLDFSVGTVTGLIGYANPFITTGSLPAGKVATAYTQKVAVDAGLAAFNFTITSGTLPAGLTLNSNTGEISGLPSAVTACPAGNFDVTVTDARGNSDTRTFCIVVTP